MNSAAQPLSSFQALGRRRHRSSRLEESPGPEFEYRLERSHRRHQVRNIQNVIIRLKRFFNPAFGNLRRRRLFVNSLKNVRPERNLLFRDVVARLMKNVFFGSPSSFTGRVWGEETRQNKVSTVLLLTSVHFWSGNSTQLTFGAIFLKDSVCLVSNSTFAWACIRRWLYSLWCIMVTLSYENIEQKS